MRKISQNDATVPRIVERAANMYGDYPAVMEDETVLTFRELADEVLDVTRAAIASGVRSRDRVGVWVPNSRQWISLALGLHGAGAVVVPINTRYRREEAWDLLSRTRASALFVQRGFLGYDHVAELRDALVRDATDLKVNPSALQFVVDLASTQGVDESVAAAPIMTWEEFASKAEEVSEAEAAARRDKVQPDDLSDVIFTSGTTGRAKGVMITHRAVIELYDVFGQTWGLKEQDRYLITLPLFHTGGNKAGMLASLLYGVTMVPMAVFDTVNAMRMIERYKITVMNGPPTIYISILDHPRRGEFDLSSLRIASTGAAVVPQTMVERCLHELQFQHFITAYGLTECCGAATMCRKGDPIEVVSRSNGSAIPGVEVIVVGTDGSRRAAGESGEVLVRGGNVTPGYWEDKTATAEAIDAAGWLRTGDIGSLDVNGNLNITDRLKDLFIVGGFNVSPAEVEQTMARHPDVSEAAVVAAPDARLGEVPVAFVILKPDRTISEVQLRVWCRERLANFKVPRKIKFVDALPRNASGKVLRYELGREITRLGDYRVHTT